MFAIVDLFTHAYFYVAEWTEGIEIVRNKNQMIICVYCWGEKTQKMVTIELFLLIQLNVYSWNVLF